MKYLPIVCLSLLVFSCVSTQPSPSKLKSYVSVIKAGATTRAEVLAALGEPTKSAPRQGGHVLTWIHQATEVRNASGTTPDTWADPRRNDYSYVVKRPTTLSIQVSARGIVTGYQLLEP